MKPRSGIRQICACLQYCFCNAVFSSLLSHRACSYIYFIQTNSCTLFKTHSHLKTKLLKMFLKHIIKILHISVTIVWPSSGGPSFVLSAVATSLLVCVVKLFISYVAVCCLCVCVPDVLVCGMFGCKLFSSQQNIPQTSTSGTHTHIDNIQLRTK
jgi:hypothetical protein